MAGKFDFASTQALNAADHTAPVVVSAGNADSVTIPGNGFLLDAEFHRSGPDLVLVGEDGREVVVTDYFAQAHPPVLLTPAGAAVEPDLAAKLAGPLAPGQFAQAAGADPHMLAVGRVDKASGTIEVQHPDGTRSTLHVGDTIYKGDVVSTKGDSAVGITFADSSTFSLGKSGRMVIDELVYDPQAQAGQSAISVVKGAFSFASGQVAKTAPEASTIKTPVMTIGIRGTSGAGQADDAGGENTIVLLPDADGRLGQVLVFNSAGVQVLNSAFQQVAAYSPYQPPTPPAIIQAAVVQALYGSTIDNRPPSPPPNTTPNQIVPDFRPSVPVEPPAPQPTPQQQTGSIDLDHPIVLYTPASAQTQVATGPVTLTTILQRLQAVQAQVGNNANQAGANVQVDQTVAGQTLQEVIAQTVEAVQQALNQQRNDSQQTGPEIKPDTQQQPQTGNDTPGSPPSFNGRAIDGYVANADVIRDKDGDGQWDPGEEATKTDGSGNYYLPGSGGLIVVKGGIDTTTGQPLLFDMKAPDGSSVVTPLTTLVVAVAGSGSNPNYAAAESKVLAMLGLSGVGVSLGSLDPIANIGTTAGKTILAATIQTVTTINALKSAFGNAVTVETIFAKMAQTANTPGGTLDFTDPASLGALITKLNGNVAPSWLDSVANALSGTNSNLADAIENATSFSSIASQVAAATSNTGSLSTVINNVASGTWDLTNAAVVKANLAALKAAGITHLHITSGNATLTAAQAAGLHLTVDDTATVTVSDTGNNFATYATQLHPGCTSYVMTSNPSNALTLAQAGALVGLVEKSGGYTFTIANASGNADTLNLSTMFDAGNGWQFDHFVRDGANLKMVLKDGAGNINYVVIIDHYAGKAVEFVTDGQEPMRLATNASGTSGDDFIIASNNSSVAAHWGTDTTANTGQDEFFFGGGANFFHGNGDDNVNFAASTSALIMSGTVNNSGNGSGAIGGYQQTFTGMRGITGTQGNDVLYGRAPSADETTPTNSSFFWVSGGKGNDTIHDGGAHTTVVDYSQASGAVSVNLSTGTATGADGHDTLIGIRNVMGSAFDDVIIGNSDDNWLDGGDGDDVINGGAGYDIVHYGDDRSGVYVNLATGTATQGNGHDMLSGIEGVIGSDYADRLIGNSQNNWFNGGKGADTIEGGQGSDTVSFATYGKDGAHGVIVNLSTQTHNNVAAGHARDGWGALDKLVSIENIQGSEYTDIIYGSAGDNSIDGGGGGDTIHGGAGNDTIVYHSGQTLSGGDGTDTLQIGGVASVSDMVGRISGFEAFNLQSGATLTLSASALGTIFGSNSAIHITGGGTLTGGHWTQSAANNGTLTLVNGTQTIIVGPGVNVDALLNNETSLSFTPAAGTPIDLGEVTGSLTLTSLPQGMLLRDGVAMGVGDTFTAEELDRGDIVYVSTDASLLHDSFAYSGASSGVVTLNSSTTHLSTGNGGWGDASVWAGADGQTAVPGSSSVVGIADDTVVVTGTRSAASVGMTGGMLTISGTLSLSGGLHGLAGSMLSVTSGLLAASGEIDGGMLWSGGTIDASGGSDVLQVGKLMLQEGTHTIADGTVAVTGEATLLQFQGSNIIQGSGELLFAEQASVFLQGQVQVDVDLTNQGNIGFADGDALDIGGTFTNAGTIEMGGSDYAARLSTHGSGAIVNDTTGIIVSTAYGQSEIGGTVTNHGQILVNDYSDAVVLDGGSFTNAVDGTIFIDTGATLTIEDGEAFENFGVLGGVGTVAVETGTLINDGTIAAGGVYGTGTLHVAGSLDTAISSASLDFDIHSHLPGRFDKLEIDGDLWLGSVSNGSQATISVRFDGYLPADVTEQYELITVGGTTHYQGLKLVSNLPDPTVPANGVTVSSNWDSRTLTFSVAVDWNTATNANLRVTDTTSDLTKNGSNILNLLRIDYSGAATLLSGANATVAYQGYVESGGMLDISGGTLTIGTDADVFSTLGVDGSLYVRDNAVIRGTGDVVVKSDGMLTLGNAVLDTDVTVNGSVVIDDPAHVKTITTTTSGADLATFTVGEGGSMTVGSGIVRFETGFANRGTLTIAVDNLLGATMETAHDFTNEGTITLGEADASVASTLWVHGAFTNAGELDSDGYYGYRMIMADQSIINAIDGTVTLGGSMTWQTPYAENHGQLNLGYDHTLTVERIDAGAGRLLNTGTISGGDYACLDLGGDLAARGALVNQGLISAEDGQTTIRANVVNQGTIFVATDQSLVIDGAHLDNYGTIEFDNQLGFTTLSVEYNNGSNGDGHASFLNHAGGTLTGYGTIDLAGADFTNAGRLDPGEGGRLSFQDGDVTLTSTSVIHLDIANAWNDDAGDYRWGTSRIDVDYGTLFMDGTLSVTMAEDMNSAETLYTALYFENSSGAFDSIEGLEHETQSYLLDPVFGDYTLELYLREAVKGSEGDNILTGQYLLGRGGNDTLTAAAGGAVVMGGAGNDTIVVDAASEADYHFLDGGNGNDWLRAVGTNLDFTDVRDDLVQRIEGIDLGTDTGANIVTLTAADVLGMTEGSNGWVTANSLPGERSLIIFGNAADTVRFQDTDWNNTTQVNLAYDGHASESYQVWQHASTEGSVTVYVQHDITSQTTT